MELTVLSWNLFHGRDFPPDPALRTWRSRLLRRTERNETHVQVNRELLPEFSRVLAAAEWDVALLQECPPRWWHALAAACGAEAHGAPTSRNSLGALRGFAARLNPDLIASGEGGSNLTLVRTPLRCALSGHSEAKEQRSGGMPLRCALSRDSGEKEQRRGRVIDRHGATIRKGRPERRAMALTRIAIGDAGDGDRQPGTGAELCVANLHATAGRPALAAEDVRRAAEAATEWAGDAPLLFGGDLNLRPAEDPAIFEELRDRFGLAAPTNPDAIDHLLVRGLDVVTPPGLWPPERREVPDRRDVRAHDEVPARDKAPERRGGSSRDGRAIRLSDHAPVEARFAAPTARE